MEILKRIRKNILSHKQHVGKLKNIKWKIYNSNILNYYFYIYCEKIFNFNFIHYSCSKKRNRHQIIDRKTTTTTKQMFYDLKNYSKELKTIHIFHIYWIFIYFPFILYLYCACKTSKYHLNTEKKIIEMCF